MHQQIPKDGCDVNCDLVDPETIRTWRPHALVFEQDLFRGDPRIPLPLLDELESAGSISIIELGAHDIWSEYTNALDSDFRASLEAFLSSRQLKLIMADGKHAHEHPVCKSFSDANKCLVIDAAAVRPMSCIANDRLFSGVRRIGLIFAVPLQWSTGNLISGGDGMHLKAYNSNCHWDTNPQLGVLYDRRGRTEAIFTGDIIWDGGDDDGAFDNHIYIANLLEVLCADRYFVNQTGWSRT
ncbi:hypothetical protein [Candidatus Methylomirabilis sp.]|uniref:hypothetical protein n=1 Tax=Candidatus Methylomirabilis sp. TaxID=2032687 RepID=UPI0030767481